MKAIIATARGFLRRSVMENALLVLGISVAVFMGAVLTGAILSYSAYMADLLQDPAYAEIVVSPAFFRGNQSQAVSKLDMDAGPMRFAFDTAAAAKAMADSPSVTWSYISEEESLRAGEAPSFGPGFPEGPPDLGGVDEQGLAPAQAQSDSSAAVSTPLLERIAGRKVSPDFFQAWGLKTAQGSLYAAADQEAGQAYMVLGSELAKSLFADAQALGKRLKIDGRIYTIIGVLERTGLLDAEATRSLDQLAFIPPRSFSPGGSGMGRPTMSLTFFVSDRAKLDSAVKELQAHFDRAYKTGQVLVTSRQAGLNARRSGQNALFGAISVLALLCLVVATLNIFNVSSIKTIRRRRSLGILRSIGVSRGKAMGVFLFEVSALALLGSLLGLAAALPLSGLALRFLVPSLGQGLAPAWAAQLTAAFLSMALPLAAGLFPAWRLLKDSPADLVRAE